MTATIPSAFYSQFSSNLFYLLEQNGSKLRSVFPTETATGEKHFFDRLGSFTANEVTARLEETVLQDAPHSRRMATIKKYTANAYLDSLDKLKILVDPTSDYAVKLANAHGKNYDTVVINALLGSAATGVDGTGSQAFDTTNYQIAAGGTGCTVDKLSQALKILQKAEVSIESDDLFLIAPAAAIEDLMADPKFTSFDYQDMKPLAGKRLPSFRGINIIHSERAPEYTAGVTGRAILTTRDALKVAIPQDMVIRTDELPGKNYAVQVYTAMTFGAVRMAEDRAVDILFTL